MSIAGPTQLPNGFITYLPDRALLFVQTGGGDPAHQLVAHRNTLISKQREQENFVLPIGAFEFPLLDWRLLQGSFSAKSHIANIHNGTTRTIQYIRKYH